MYILERTKNLIGMSQTHTHKHLVVLLMKDKQAASGVAPENRKEPTCFVIVV